MPDAGEVPSGFSVVPLASWAGAPAVALIELPDCIFPFVRFLAPPLYGPLFCSGLSLFRRAAPISWLALSVIFWKAVWKSWFESLWCSWISSRQVLISPSRLLARGVSWNPWKGAFLIPLWLPAWARAFLMISSVLALP